MQELIPLSELIVKLTAVLGASFVIERILSFFNVVINRLFIWKYSNKYTQLDKLQEELIVQNQAFEEDKILQDETANYDNTEEEIPFHPNLPEYEKINSEFDIQLIKPLEKIVDDQLRFKKYLENNTIVKEFWMQIIGVLIATIVCRALDFSIFDFFLYDLSKTSSTPDPGFFGCIFTGVIIGSGSKPINFLMNFLTNRKIILETQKVKEEVDKEQCETIQETANQFVQNTTDLTINKSLTIEEIVGFVYDQGDRPDRLENTHKYTKEIDLIVYHHTCLRSNAPFTDLVKVFDDKGWLTGYNCVVFEDGTIRVLCRWDRFGNHAKGYNSRSFGIAFQGNFETNPNVSFSNPDGKLGNITPTDRQLKAAARVIAMYTLMHNIPFVFPNVAEKGKTVKGIIPHNVISSKTCPGNNFPYIEFEKLITHYYNDWKDDAEFGNALEIFKNKPRVMSK